MLLISRLVCALASVFATVFLIYCLKKGWQPSYFRCIFYGILAQLLTSLFYLAVSTDPDWNHVFTLGSFGEVATCLFLATANLRFIPKEYEEHQKHLSVPGLFGALIALAIYVAATLFNHSFEYILCNVLYAASAGFYLYTAMDVIANKYKNAFKEGVKTFNVLYALSVIASSLLQLAIAWMNIPFVIFSIFAMSAMTLIALVFGTISLKKGLEPWVM